MRGDDQQQSHMFSYLSPEARVRKDHPLRAIRVMVDEVLGQLSARFSTMYARVGRPSIAPEKLLRAQLLQMLYSVRSERLLMEEMDYNLLFRWFVGLNADDEVWDATSFTKNRDRLLEADVAKEFLLHVVEQARAKGLTSEEHFTVDGTLLEAWASLKSFQPKQGKPSPPPDDPGNPTVNFRGEKRSNQTHASKTDPEALLARKSQGKESKLSYNGNLPVENRKLIVDAEGFHPTARRNATRHLGYTISQRKRKRIEECFGWLKTVALMRKVRHRGVCKVHWIFTLACAAYNLVRIRNLATPTPAV
jgi:transposase